MATACIGLGSNLGDRRAHLALAERMLRDADGVVRLAMSQVYETEPVGPIDQGRFLNAAARVQTTLSPRALLRLLRRIEARAGRTAEAERVRWGPRELDLDMLLYDGRVIDIPGLVVPHPRMHERWFVLKPLADVAPDATHPVLNQRVPALLAAIEKKEAIRAE